MSTLLAPGANAPLAQSFLALTFSTGTIPGAEIDVSGFLVTASGKVRGDDDMCFYGQPRVAGGALGLTSAAGGRASFDLDLSRLPAGIEKVVFAATIHENRASFGALREITYAVQGGPSGMIPCQGKTETALLLAEVYRRNGQWKVRTIGQGFNGGLAALATHLGVDIAAPAPAPAPAPRTSAAPAAAPRPLPTPAPAPAAPPVSLTKVSLTKSNNSISLKKTSGDFGNIQVNLNWNQRPASGGGGFLGGLMGPKPLDLDLGCFVEDRYGNMTCVQALGRTFGKFDYFPYVKLRGDDRTGAVRDGEWLDINGKMWAEFNRILVFAFIYEGAPNWQETDGVVRLLIPEQPEIEVRMNEYGLSQGMCAVASLENDGGRIRVNREVKFFNGHRDMDNHYGWGMNWVAGAK